MHEPPPATPEPWGRLPNESAKAFAAFCAYRDAGSETRSTATVARALGKTKTLCDRWSSRHGWVARAAAWDAEIDRRKREALIAGALAMAERHVRLSHWLQQKIAERLRDLNPRELTPAELVSWLKVAVAVERQARGLDTPAGAAVTIQNQVIAAAEAGANTSFTPEEERAGWRAVYLARYGVPPPWDDAADEDAYALRR